MAEPDIPRNPTVTVYLGTILRYHNAFEPSGGVAGAAEAAERGLHAAFNELADARQAIADLVSGAPEESKWAENVKLRAALRDIAYYGASVPLEMTVEAYHQHAMKDMRRIAMAALGEEPACPACGRPEYNHHFSCAFSLPGLPQ